MEQCLQGLGVSPGIAIAPALLFFHDRYDVPVYAISDLDAELDRLDAAIESTRADLKGIYERTVSNLGKTHADIFHAHLLILEDVALREDVISKLHDEMKNVEHILELLAKRYVTAMDAVNDPRFRERTADMLDVLDRMLRHLLDAERPNLRQLERDSIILARDLTPSDTATIDAQHAQGLIVETGSVTSHSAILARALEIPAVVGISNISNSISNGVMVILDGISGQVIVDPSSETLARYIKARQRIAEQQASLLQAATTGPAHTSDGAEVTLRSNIELPLEIPHSLNVGAQGIGLYRTEYLFINRDSLPDEEEQFTAYADAARAMNPYPVVLRTIDVGGDKFVAHLQIAREENPQLGWRAVRFCLARPDIFKTQLRAMFRASIYGTTHIMFPMISGVEELRKVKDIVNEVRHDLELEHISFDAHVKIGCMIEVPSAVMLADLLAEESDFFSIGTNDLIQYLLAVDRVNEKIAHLYEPAHPAVIRMIRHATAAAAAHGIPCSICGEMAGDPLYTELLLGLGITELSMAPVAIPLIRAEISHINMEEARAMAQEVVAMKTASEIKTVIRNRHLLRSSQFDYFTESESDSTG